MAFEKFAELYRDGKVSISTMLKAAAFKEELEKTGGPGIELFLKYLATGLALSAGVGLMSAGAGMAAKSWEAHQLEDRKDELFREMVKLHPELMQNKERARLYFDALMHFSPIVAQNPLTAGAYIRSALQYDHAAGGPLPQSVNELAQISKATAQARKDAPKSPLGTMLTGISETPAKLAPGMMSFGDYSKLD